MLIQHSYRLLHISSGIFFMQLLILNKYALIVHMDDFMIGETFVSHWNYIYIYSTGNAQYIKSIFTQTAMQSLFMEIHINVQYYKLNIYSFHAVLLTFVWFLLWTVKLVRYL